MDAPVKVAWAPNQPQAELLQGLLLEYGIPSVVRRQLGFDLPDYLAAGSRDILVPAEAEADARAVLAPTDVAPEAGVAVELPEPSGHPRWARAMALVLVAMFFATWIWGLLSAW